MMEKIWEEESVVQDWKDAEIILIPRKGDLTECDNWHGISLLDVAGKVCARILQERLLVIAKKVLPELQCGFRQGTGCINMIFFTRQLVEKCREHDCPLFILFIGLEKAYDSVPREALWQVLEKSSVPPTMLTIIRSFHDDMTAEVTVEILSLIVSG